MTMITSLRVTVCAPLTQQVASVSPATSVPEAPRNPHHVWRENTVILKVSCVFSILGIRTQGMVDSGVEFRPGHEYEAETHGKAFHSVLLLLT